MQPEGPGANVFGGPKPWSGRLALLEAAGRQTQVGTLPVGLHGLVVRLLMGEAGGQPSRARHLPSTGGRANALPAR